MFHIKNVHFHLRIYASNLCTVQPCAAHFITKHFNFYSFGLYGHIYLILEELLQYLVTQLNNKYVLTGWNLQNSQNYANHGLPFFTTLECKVNPTNICIFRCASPTHRKLWRQQGARPSIPPGATATPRQPTRSTQASGLICVWRGIIR